MATSLTANNPRVKDIRELVNYMFMCVFVFMFDGFVLVNFLHLWKLIICCPGSEEADDDDDGDKKTFICQVV